MKLRLTPRTIHRRELRKPRYSKADIDVRGRCRRILEELAFGGRGTFDARGPKGLLSARRFGESAHSQRGVARKSSWISGKPFLRD
jgi:hypothetical protein